MKKKDLIKALEKFNDDDHIIFEDFSSSYVPKMEAVCGRTEAYTAHFCVLKPNHEGDCYSSCKDVDFTPDPRNMKEVVDDLYIQLREYSIDDDLCVCLNGKFIDIVWNVPDRKWVLKCENSSEEFDSKLDAIKWLEKYKIWIEDSLKTNHEKVSV